MSEHESVMHPRQDGKTQELVKRLTWSIQWPTRDGWYWVRNAVAEGWEAETEPQVVRVYGFSDGLPIVTLPSQEDCSDLAEIDAE